MKKSTVIVLTGIVLAALAGVFFLLSKKGSNSSSLTDNTEIDLPINTIPVTERPFITLAPDGTGRSLNITVDQAPAEGEMEYEMVYQASGKQEGALGSIFLGSEKQPIVKSILLGSKSGGGKVTYHEGVTGGSLTVTYGQTRLKESWNYLKYDGLDPVFSVPDGKFSVELAKTGLKKDQYVVTMKTFGLPSALPEGTGSLLVGPYAYFAQSAVKGSVQAEFTLPSGDHASPTIYEWDGKVWKKLVTKAVENTVTASVTGHVFVVVSE